MAQRIIGLDIGSYALKAVHLDSTFRSSQVVGYKELRVSAEAEPGGDNPLADVEALRAWRAEETVPPESVICALPGDVTLTRFLKLPFKDRKRIDEVIGFELEDQLPYDLDEIVFDYQIIDRSDEGARIFAVAVPHETLEGYLSLLKEADIDPKVVSFGAWSYVNLAPQLQVPADTSVAIVDIGHRRTDVCVFRNGVVEFVRTTETAGAHLDAVVAQRLGIDVHEADVRKRSDGRVGGNDDDPLAAALSEGLEEVVAGVRLALLAHQSGTSHQVERIYVCGGSSELPGLNDFFERRLGLPVLPVDIAGMDVNRMPNPSAGGPILAKGIALSLRGLGAGAASEVNLRRGPFAFQGEFRYLRDKVTALVLMVVALLSIAGFRAYTRHKSLSAQHEAQLAELAQISEEVLGRTTEDFDVVLRKLRTTPEDAENPFPEIDAFTLFYDITTAMDEVKKMPRGAAKGVEDEGAGDEEEGAAEEGAEAADSEDGDKEAESADHPPDDRYIIEFESVQIQKSNGTLKGQANDIEAYELFLAKLREHRCLKKVETQDTDIVTFRRHTGWRQFQTRFEIDCTERKKAKAPKPEEKRGEEAPAAAEEEE